MNRFDLFKGRVETIVGIEKSSLESRVAVISVKFGRGHLIEPTIAKDANYQSFGNFSLAD